MGRKKINRMLLWGVVLMLLLCIVHALSACRYSDFYPTNGTFQNYNPVRRLLSGQIPYKDFQDYLGLGHLYLGSIVTSFFGGTYNDSLMAFSFLSFFGLALIFVVIGNAVLQKKDVVVALTNILLGAILLEMPVMLLLSGNSTVNSALNSALDTGNSARFIRGMILPLSIVLIIQAMKLKNCCCGKIPPILKDDSVRMVAAISSISGFAFGWSNDYGISCWVCLAILTFWIVFCRERNMGKALGFAVTEIVLSFVWMFLFVELMTLGNFTAWLKATFGTGGYQAWYYNSPKSFYLYDVDFSFEMLLQAIISIMYLWKVFKENGSIHSIKRYGMLAYANMCCFCAANEYRILSGGTNREVALSVLFATVAFEAVCYFSRFKIYCKGYAKNAIFVVSFIMGIALCGTLAKDEIQFIISDKDGVYVENMDGYLTSYGNDLLETDAFLDGTTVFATYASAQEVVSETYQPSGTDYIIHVLGDDARNCYMESFRKDAFDYVATIKKSLNGWEYWAERANWFFFRELYASYHPIYSNTYEIYWGKNKKQDENSLLGEFEVDIETVNDYTKKLVIQTDEDVSGMADVYLDYSVKKNKRKSSLLVIRTILKLENTWETKDINDWNCLRPEGAEFIPVPVTDGYGELTITSQPTANTCLEINSATCNRIFTVISE